MRLKMYALKRYFLLNCQETDKKLAKKGHTDFFE